MSGRSLSSAILEASERKSKSGTGRRALEAILKQHATEDGLLDLGSLSRVVDALLPGTSPREVLALFEAHSQQAHSRPGLAISVRSFADSIMSGDLPPARRTQHCTYPDEGSTAPGAAATLAPAAATRPTRPPLKHAWDEWSAPAPVPPVGGHPRPLGDRNRNSAPADGPHHLSRHRTDGVGGRGPPAPAARPQVPAHTMSEAIRQLQQVLDLRASSATGALPPTERLTLHLSARLAAARQIALLRAVRRVAPNAARVSEAELSAVLAALAFEFAAQRGHGSARVVFGEVDVQKAMWHAAADGDINALLALICPLPQPADRPPPHPHRFDGEYSGRYPGQAQGVDGASVGVGSGAPDAAAATSRPAFGPPFDRETGRKGRRHVAPPDRDSVPLTIRYRFSQSGVHVPPHFDPRLVTRSALPPDVSVRREFVYGYNGLGRHNRAPNVFALADGRVLYCAAALAIVYDPGTSEQTFFEGHDDDITCVALHPAGRLAVTGQCASALAGTAPWLAVWDVESKEELSRVGWVPDDREASTLGRAHAPGATPAPQLPPTALPAAHATAVPPPAAYRAFYQRSVCAVAFSAEGSLLIGVGTDDQHTIGVWNWRRRELLVSAPSLTARPPGIHQLALAPGAPPGGSLTLVSVGLAAQPKFWTLSPPQKQPTGTQRRLAAATGADGPQLSWALRSQLGRIGGAEGELPKSLSCVAFGGGAFASPTGAPHGLVFIGGGGGRIFVFDYPSSPAAIHIIRDAHAGVAVTALAAADGGILSGGADGRILFWAPAPPGKDASGKERRPYAIQKPAHTYVVGHRAEAAAPSSGRAAAGAAAVPPALKGERRQAKAGKDATAVSAAAALGSSLVGGAGAIRSLAVFPRARAQPNTAPGGRAAGGGGEPGEAPLLGVAAATEEDRRGVRFADVATPLKQAAAGSTPAGVSASGGAGGLPGAGGAAPPVNSRLAGLTLPRLLVGTARCSLWVCAPPRTGKDASPTGTSQELIAGHFADALAVEPHPLRPDVWASAGADKQLLLWQHGPRRTPVQRAELPVGAACLAFSPDASLLAAGLLNGGIAVFAPAPLDYPAAAAVARVQVVTPQRDGRAGLCDLKFAPGSGAHGGYLAAAGHDRVIDVYRVQAAPGAGRGVTLVQVACCRGHTGTVTHLDWSADGAMLMSNCAAREILFWAMPAGKRMVSHAPHVAAAAWASWTCVLGFPAIGIWPDGSDGSDVNAAHRSADGRLLLTADDFGTLKLFHCPCVVEDAPFRAATGHCSHVSCARFLAGDELAVSSGGSDRSVMLWRIAPLTDDGTDAFRQRAQPISRAAWRSNGCGHAANPERG